MRNKAVDIYRFAKKKNAPELQKTPEVCDSVITEHFFLIIYCPDKYIF